jgi:hypothetical protein
MPSHAVTIEMGQITMHQGQTVLVTDPRCPLRWPSPHGLFLFDTRAQQPEDPVPTRSQRDGVSVAARVARASSGGENPFLLNELPELYPTAERHEPLSRGGLSRANLPLAAGSESRRSGRCWI